MYWRGWHFYAINNSNISNSTDPYNINFLHIHKICRPFLLFLKFQFIRMGLWNDSVGNCALLRLPGIQPTKLWCINVCRFLYLIRDSHSKFPAVSTRWQYSTYLSPCYRQLISFHRWGYLNSFSQAGRLIPLRLWWHTLRNLAQETSTETCIDALHMTRIVQFDWSAVFESFWYNQAEQHSVQCKFLVQVSWACVMFLARVFHGWSSSGIWLGQPRRKIITVSSPPLCVRHLTGGDPLDAQEPPGSSGVFRNMKRGGRKCEEVWTPLGVWGRSPQKLKNMT